jgi:hypothetical protein
MSQRFTLDRKSFEQFLAALSLVEQMKNQAAYARALNDPNQPFVSLLQLQRAINSGTFDLSSVMAGVVKLTQSVVGANAAGIWLFRSEDEFSCWAQVGSLYDPARLGTDILAYLARSNQGDPNARAYSGTLRKASHYPGSPNSVAVAAMRVNSKIVGAVAAFSTDFDAFASRDLDNLHFLAGLMQQALQKAMEAGYREAVALEDAALLRVLENIDPRLSDFERQLSRWKQAHPEDTHDSAASHASGVYTRLQQKTGFPAHFSEPAETSAPVVVEVRPTDISVPGIGVRAALGDVREFTGDEQHSFFREALRRATIRGRTLAVQSRSGAASIVAAITLRARTVAGQLAIFLGRLLGGRASLPSSRYGSVATPGGGRFARISQWRLKIHLVGLPRLGRPSFLGLELTWLRSAWSGSLGLAQSFYAKSRTWLTQSKDRFIYTLRLARVQERSMWRELRQGKADFLAMLAHEKFRMRVIQRRQKTILTNSAEMTRDALQPAGESLGKVASSAGHSTITALADLKARLGNCRRPAVNGRALRRSGSAIAVLAIMAIFVGLQARVRHSFQSEHVSAASLSTTPAAATTVPAALAITTVQPKPGPSSHLEITDTSVAGSLHDLTRYEIITLQRAAEYGDDDAAFQLGMAYETGYYVRQDCVKAAHWVKIAAESGNPAAAYNLGLRYRTGDGGQADESAAGHWLRMASARRYSPGNLALAAAQ